MSKLRIRGYCDRPNVEPGEALSFYVSSDDPGTYTATLVRLINGDLNPLGPGPQEVALDNPVNGTYPARDQRTQIGGYIEVPDLRGELAGTGGIGIHAFISSMIPQRGRQGIMSRWSEADAIGWALVVDESGCLAFQIGDGKDATSLVKSDRPLFPDTFYSVTASFDPQSRELTLSQTAVVNSTNSRFGKVVNIDSDTVVTARASSTPGIADVPVIVAGIAESGGRERTWVVNSFNGKVDSPSIYRVPLNEDDRHRLDLGDRVRHADTLARWDFAAGIGPDGIPTDLVRDVSGHRRHGMCVNQPDRAMTGWNWLGIEEHFVHAPEQYGAIWFHEDSIDDCRWMADFELQIPDDLRSGCYAIHVEQNGNEDWIPFFVRPIRGTATAKILVLIPTASYLAYANTQVMQNSPIAQAVLGHIAVLEETDLELNERPWIYGLSTYDYHIDGRGCQYTTWRRPILNMRPRYRHEFGSVWQFPADLQLIDWLYAQGYEVDVATDHDLMEEGSELFKRYNVVITGSHPEYYTRQMVDAWEEYLSEGGRGMYLAANGMYWITSQHPEKPWVLEVRKGEQGDQAWRARPGELFHSTSGERGGLWRMRARASAKVWGVVYTSHGLDVSTGYERMPDSYDSRLEWMFDGIAKDEVIGDFGLVGGGAAGLEIDRYDQLLGTPPNAALVASSYGHSPNWGLVPEEQYFVGSGMNGPEHPGVRSDIVYFTTRKGGAMFSTSSMTWEASLSWNEYENNVSTLTANVLRKFAQDGPIEELI